MSNMIKMVIAGVLLSLAGMVQAADGVARSAFTTAIEDREPVDQVGQLTNEHSKIYFFTELRGMSGHTVTHRWEQGGEVRAEVSFNVGGDRWRVWSSKNLEPSWLGEWQVSVMDEGGNVIAQESFAYIPAGDESTDVMSEGAAQVPSETGAADDATAGSASPATDAEQQGVQPGELQAEEVSPPSPPVLE